MATCIFLGDFNTGVGDTSEKDFCRSFNLTSMINKPTFYKNPDGPTWIDLILTNSPRSFQNSCVIDTGLSNLHRMIVTVMKTTYRKLEPRTVHYCDFKFFCINSFKELFKKSITRNSGVGRDKIYESFATSCNKILDNHAPLNKKYVRANLLLFMNKPLSKGIMIRTKLRNIFLKNRSEENKLF